MGLSRHIHVGFYSLKGHTLSLVPAVVPAVVPINSIIIQLKQCVTKLRYKVHPDSLYCVYTYIYLYIVYIYLYIYYVPMSLLYINI